MLRIAKLITTALVALGVSATATAQVPQAITITSNLETKVRPYAPAPAVKAFASVVLLAGGNGVLNLTGAGDVRELSGNFLIRSARAFLNLGMNVAMLDSAAPGLTNQRHTPQHAAHLVNVIEVVRNQWPNKRVWLVGTSNGTISAVNAAAHLMGKTPPGLPGVVEPDMLAGIVLTSSVTAPDPDGDLHFVTEPNLDLNKVKVPTLVVWHKEDSCPFSHNDKAFGVFKRLLSVPASKKQQFIVSQGAPNVAMSACSAFGFHGFNGSENFVVAGIAKFIKKHSPKN